MTRFVVTVRIDLYAETPIEAVRQTLERKMLETLAGKAETIGEMFNQVRAIMDGTNHTETRFGWVGLLTVKEHD